MERMARRAPALLIAAAALAAVLAAAGTSVLELCLAATIALTALYAFRSYRGAPAAFAVSFIFIYACTLWLAPSKAVPGGTCRYKAVVERADCRERSQQLVATVTHAGGEASEQGLRMLLTVTDIVPRIEAGDSVSFSAAAVTTGRYRDIPHMAMQELFERSERISAKAVLNGAEISVTGHSTALRYSFAAMRATLADAIHASPLPAAAARLLEASVLGGGDIDRATKEDYRLAGVSHLLCVSGFHTGVVAAAVWFLLLPLVFLPHGRAMRNCLALVCIWAYALVVGFTPSVIRASIMLTVLWLSKAYRRDTNSVNALCIAFVAVLAINPYWLFSAGFQLSFAAVAGLLLMASRLNPVSQRQRMPYNAAALIATPLAATLGTLPVMMAWFHRVPVLTIAVNALAMLLFPVFMLAGAVVVALGCAGIELHWLTSAVASLHDFMNYGIERVAGLSDSVSPWLSGGTAVTVLAALAVAALAAFLNMEKKRERLAAASASALFLLTACALPAEHTSPAIYLDACGNATVMHTVVDGMACAAVLDGKKPEINNFSHYYAAFGIFEDRIDFAEGNFAKGSVERTDSVLRAGGLDILMPSDSTPPHAASILLLGRGYRGDLQRAIAAARPRAVVLSAGIDSRRRRAYSAICASAGTLCADLTEKAFGFSSENR